MGTDTFERTIPCPCGKGEILITTTTPDHAWVTVYNTDHTYQILCKPCADEYVLVDSRVVRRADRVRQIAAERRYAEARTAFESSDGFIEVVRAFGRHLEGMPSVAAIHRYLTGQQLDSYSIGAFRKHWRDGHHWADRNIGSWNLPKVLSLLGLDTTQFDAELQNLNDLQAAIPAVPTVMSCHPKTSRR